MAEDTRPEDTEEHDYIRETSCERKNISRKLSQDAEDLHARPTANIESRKLQAHTSGPFDYLENPLPRHQVHFQRAVQLAIVLNSAQMGLVFEIGSEGNWQTVWEVCDDVFTAFFLLEALIKGYQYRCAYFTDKKERLWNITDLLVVLVTVLDNWILRGGSDLAVMKVFRLVRLSRVLRLLKEQKDLMMVVIGIVGSLKSMAWVGVLLLVVVYASAIGCCTIIGRSDVYGEDDPEVNFTADGNPSLQRAIFTLLNLSLGQGHMETLNPLFRNQIFMLPVMFIWIMVVTVGILNSIIGIICEKTAEAGRANAEEEKKVFRDKQKGLVETLKTLIWEMNEDGDGIISQEELDAAANDPKFVEMLKEINLPSSFSVTDMHLMLDKDGDGELTEEEFADGMYDLVYSNDFQRQCILLRSLANAKRNLHDFRTEVKREFRDLRELLIRQDKQRKQPPRSGAAKAADAPAAVSPAPPGGMPPAFGCSPGVSVLELMDQRASSPSPAGWALEDGDCVQSLATLKEVRANALKAVAVGAWELLEQDGAVQKALSASSSIHAMKQVRAKALKAQAERQASGPLRAAAGGTSPISSGPCQPLIGLGATSSANGSLGKVLPSDALAQLPGAYPSAQLPGAYPSSPRSPGRPLPFLREEV